MHLVWPAADTCLTTLYFFFLQAIIFKVTAKVQTVTSNKRKQTVGAEGEGHDASHAEKGTTAYPNRNQNIGFGITNPLLDV